MESEQLPDSESKPKKTKEDFEIEKLQREISALKGNWMVRLILPSMFPALVAFGSVLIALSAIPKGLIDTQSANLELQKTKLQLDIASFQEERRRLIIDTTELFNRTITLQDSLSKQQFILDSSSRVLSNLQKQLWTASQKFYEYEDRTQKSIFYLTQSKAELEATKKNIETTFHNIDNLPALFPLRILDENGIELSTYKYEQVGSVTDTLRAMLKSGQRWSFEGPIFRLSPRNSMNAGEKRRICLEFPDDF